MDQETTTIIEQQISALPTELKNFFMAREWLTATREIAGRFGLSPEHSADLENGVMFALIAMDLKANLQKNLEESLEIDSGLAGTIVSELEQKVFAPINHLLPTEMEGPETLSSGAENLIEDTEGNKDNVLPPLPTNTTLEQKLEPLTDVQQQENKDWEERKKALADNTVATNRYNGNDPYREPTN